MQRSLRLVLSLILILSLVSLTSFAQEKAAASGKPSPEEMQKMMAEFMKLGAPGPQHELLSKLAGEWTNNSKMWMDATSEPMTTPPGVHKGEMILGGRFLQFTEKGEMMGMPMEGFGLMGYNKMRNQYEMLWTDNTATPMYLAYGTIDSTNKVISLLGMLDDPMTHEKDKAVKYIYRFVDDKTVIFEMWDTDKNGTFFKSMETTYTKK